MATGTVGTLLGAAAIASVIAWHRSSVSRGTFLILAGLILAADVLVFLWALRAAREVPIICGAVCPKCGASLVSQRDEVTSFGRCTGCNAVIVDAA